MTKLIDLWRMRTRAVLSMAAVILAQVDNTYGRPRSGWYIFKRIKSIFYMKKGYMVLQRNFFLVEKCRFQSSFDVLRTFHS